MNDAEKIAMRCIPGEKVGSGLLRGVVSIDGGFSRLRSAAEPAIEGVA